MVLLLIIPKAMYYLTSSTKRMLMRSCEQQYQMVGLKNVTDPNTNTTKSSIWLRVDN
ncbi:hypothetical protein YC2023_022789 [Brassica napus]